MIQYNMAPSPQRWQGGPHVQDQAYQNYNNKQTPYASDQFYGGTEVNLEVDNNLVAVILQQKV